MQRFFLFAGPLILVLRTSLFLYVSIAIPRGNQDKMVVFYTMV